jgi:hypothetical protein
MSETIAPTLERVRNATFGVDEPEIGQKIERRAYHIRDIFGHLAANGDLDEDQVHAGRRFARHLELAYRGRSVTPSYGQRFAEGTPVGQLAAAAAEDDAARVVDYYVLHHRAKDALPPKPRLAMMLALEEQKGLSDIGKVITTFNDRHRRCAVATAMIQTACDVLISHYNIRRHDPYP